jgi:hypothetical protein
MPATIGSLQKKECQPGTPINSEATSTGAFHHTNNSRNTRKPEKKTETQGHFQ